MAGEEQPVAGRHFVGESHEDGRVDRQSCRGRKYRLVQLNQQIGVLFQMSLYRSYQHPVQPARACLREYLAYQDLGSE